MSKGYTEAERMALEWSKQQRNSKSSYSHKLIDNIVKHNVNQDKQLIERYNNNHYEVSYTVDRSKSSWERSRSRSKTRTKEKTGRESPTYSPYRGNDEDDNIIINPKNDDYKRRTNDSNRSRSRSRSRSRDRRKTNITRSRSRSRESRKNIDSSWSHDLFYRSIDDSPRNSPKRLPDDYKPPSPEWISRAGGVAIMRKKKSS